MTKRKKPETPEEIARWAEEEAAKERISLSDKILQILKAMPTEIGTLNERKILAVKMLPEYRFLSVSRLCKEAGLTREAWYRIHKSPKFSNLCIDFIRAIKGTFVPQLFMALVQNALNGDTRAALAVLEDTATLRGQENGNQIAVNLFGDILRNRNDDERHRQRGNLASILGEVSNGSRFTVSDN